MDVDIGVIFEKPRRDDGRGDAMKPCGRCRDRRCKLACMLLRDCKLWCEHHWGGQFSTMGVNALCVSGPYKSASNVRGSEAR